ncbi:MAG: hypothetical protein ACR2GX_00475 [Candidatus Dormibacteria bacterium]
MSADSPLASLPPNCQALWQFLGPNAVPGQSLMTGSPERPTIGTIHLQIGVDGKEWATAFIRTQRIEDWAISTGNLGVLSELDPPNHPRDAIETAMVSGGVVTVPACEFPTGLTAVSLAPAQLTAIRQRGWPDPSASALLVTFPACTGVVVTYSNGRVETLGAIDHSLTLVITGHTIVNEPFGTIWVTDGQLACDVDPVLRPVCALA